MRGPRIALPLAAAFACAIAALAIVPAGIEAGMQLRAQDDPVRIADRALDRSFDAAAASREIEAALQAGDVELANSFRDLAHDRNIALDPALARRLDDANSASATAARAAGRFAHGLITGEPSDVAGLAGTTVGDLFVFGDIRDAIREGSRMAAGEPADELILGLAAGGIAITAGTYVSLGGAAPARVGVSVLKAARRTGRITAQLGEWMSRSLRQAVDWSTLRNAVSSASIVQPGAATRAVRQAVNVEKSRDLVRMVSDIGRVQSRAGTQAALDGLRLAQGPRDVARVARLADVKGTRTRAVMKFLGRGAIFLAATTFSLASWMWWAIMTVLMLVVSLKRTVERATERSCARRRAKRARAVHRYLAMTARA